MRVNCWWVSRRYFHSVRHYNLDDNALTIRRVKFVLDELTFDGSRHDVLE